jgi:UDP-N-acetylglucosamine 3-dehydrogenase
MKKLTVAVIGIGNMGKNHVRTYAGIDSIDLVAISDLNEKLGGDMSTKYNVDFYDDYEKMLELVKPDMVSICVPTFLHHKVAKYCLEKGVHVLLEKPIAMNLEEGADIIKTAKKNKVKLLVGHIERFNPAVNKLKELIQKGEIGKITAIIARRVGGFPPQIKDANIAVDLAIHDIDIVNYLLDELPQEIYLNKQRNHIMNREDSVEFFLKYGYASAYVQTNWITPVKIRKLNITGSEGYIEMDYINQQIELYQSNYDKFLEKVSDFSDYVLRFSEPDKIVISVAKKEPLKEEILFFAESILNDQEIDCQYSLDALKIALTEISGDREASALENQDKAEINVMV